MSKILPVETQICEIVKKILKVNKFLYVRKYSDCQIRKGEKTGRRSHKFWAIFPDRSGSEPPYAKPNYRAVYDEICDAVEGIDSSYTVKEVYTRWGTVSIRISPAA